MEVLQYMSPNIQTLLIFIIVFLSAWILLRRRHSSLPPGPFSLPILGTLPWLGADIREPLRKLKDKYGDVFTIYLGSTPVVILCTQEVIKEAFVKHGDAFSGRPQDLFFIKEFSEGGKGVGSSQGIVWKQQRKFTHNILREFGMGRSMLEEKIHEELIFFLKEIEKTEEKPFDPHLMFQTAISNIICNIVYGARNQYEDPAFQQYMDRMSKCFEIVGNSGPLNVFPFLRFLPGDLFSYKFMKQCDNIFNLYYQEKIAEHRRTFMSGVVRDFIDAYLTEMEKQMHDPASTFDDLQLQHIISDLFHTGSETISSTLRWAVVFMLRHPDVQSRVQKEIYDVIGSERAPSMKDKISMPYTDACLLEIQRMADLVPLGVPHTTTEDVHFKGYLLPKGTWVFSNLYCVHRDANTFEDPYSFKPERFLDSDGNVYGRETIIPFSMGKRVCLGESLARMELFLFFTALLQRFTFTLPPNQELPGTTGILGLTNQPYPFKMIATLNEQKPVTDSL